MPKRYLTYVFSLDKIQRYKHLTPHGVKNYYCDIIKSNQLKIYFKTNIINL